MNCQQFLLWRSLKKKYPMDFHERVTKLLEIYSVMDARIGEELEILKKNFK